MRKLAYLSLMLVMSVPAFAQTAAPNSARNENHSAVHECVREHLHGLREQLKGEVHAHMQQFRTQNPNASTEARHEERKSFVKSLKEAHSSEIRSAVQACRH